MATHSLPLEGLKILDFSHAAAGPFATMFLADLGAEVFKVEKPGRGDGARQMGEPLLGPMDSDYFVSLNRNKKSVLIDLAAGEGRDVAKALASKCDLVVQNFRPGVMERLGLGYEDLRALRQGLIYCSISAFGSSGPWRERPANDIIMQSVSGLMGITGEVGGGPVRIGAPIADFATGLFAMSGVLAALYSREKHPEGQHVEVAMLDASIAMMSNYLPSVATLGKSIPRLGRGHAQIVPYQAFMCADGQYIMVGAFTQGFWRRLCEAVQHPEWVTNPKFENNAARMTHRNELLSLLEGVFARSTRSEWLDILEKADVPNGAVLELADALQSPQALHNGIVQHIEDDNGQPMDVIKLPIVSDSWRPLPPTVPPAMGEHTEQILSGLLNVKAERLEELLRAGIVGASVGRRESETSTDRRDPGLSHNSDAEDHA